MSVIRGTVHVYSCFLYGEGAEYFRRTVGDGVRTAENNAARNYPDSVILLAVDKFLEYGGVFFVVYIGEG